LSIYGKMKLQEARIHLAENTPAGGSDGFVKSTLSVACHPTRVNTKLTFTAVLAVNQRHLTKSVPGGCTGGAQVVHAWCHGAKPEKQRVNHMIRVLVVISVGFCVLPLRPLAAPANNRATKTRGTPWKTNCC
jgi:hypothetical protein